ncbi:hypothetical protein GCM10012275_42860 [Longimycelium tulufanense]|uniref:Uncharacterized protein n=1 Tax=Longimycelium tulufanense TaxID=907463 RepID=A0A8J3FXF6_9PSEU|nr:hypothetical protein [Longimycelium tulufanense]GGM67705.1 hypothetical protein GCM10012275_42860 [Longimycelium tulufanense]
MSSIVRAGGRGPRMFSLDDYRRCYVLYEDVRCNIPRWGSLGEPGAWNWARGLLVELVRRRGGTPLALHYRELETSGPLRLPAGLEVTAEFRDADGMRVTVTSHREGVFAVGGEFWRLTVDDQTPDEGTGTYPPSLPVIAYLVHQHLNRRRQPGPVHDQTTPVKHA